MKNLVYYNLKLIGNLNTAIAVAFLVIITLMVNMKFLTYKEAAVIGETYVSIIGIILFPYLCTIEYSNNIKETIFTKKTSFMNIVLLRIIIMIFLTILCISTVTAIEIYSESSFNAVEIIFGTFITTFFLGMIGITVSNIFENDILGYMVAFMYYFFELFDGGKHTKDFYLFSLTRGSFSYGKYYILLISIILLILNLRLIYKKG